MQFDLWLLGETRSSVAVHVSDSGVLTGTVATDTEVYYFEVCVCMVLCMRVCVCIVYNMYRGIL